MQLEKYIDIYLQVPQQKFVSMGGGFILKPVSRTFLDLKKAESFVLGNGDIWKIQACADRFGVRKIKIKYIEYPEVIVIDKCDKKPELIREHFYKGIKYTTKSCCKDHSFFVPEEVNDFRDMIDEAS